MKTGLVAAGVAAGRTVAARLSDLWCLSTCEASVIGPVLPIYHSGSNTLAAPFNLKDV